MPDIAAFSTNWRTMRDPLQKTNQALPGTYSAPTREAGDEMLRAMPSQCGDVGSVEMESESRNTVDQLVVAPFAERASCPSTQLDRS